jgi:hypothetical protein
MMWGEGVSDPRLVWGVGRIFSSAATGFLCLGAPRPRMTFAYLRTSGFPGRYDRNGAAAIASGLLAFPHSSAPV